MILRFAKGKHGKGPSMTCIRDDGTTTWISPAKTNTTADFFARHDLVHYAVETGLGYDDAFFGLVAKGRDLDEFGTRDGMKDTYTLEAGLAEGIVGAVQFPDYNGGPPLSDAEAFETLRATFASVGAPEPPLTVEQFGRLRVRAAELHRQWDELPEGGVLELEFPPSSS
jgi:hypothetical protein